MSDIKKKMGVVTSTAGGISSVIGIVGTGCAAGCAGGGLLVGVITATLGAGTAAFLYQYSTLFTIVGIGMLILGIVLILKRSKNTCSL